MTQATGTGRLLTLPKGIEFNRPNVIDGYKLMRAVPNARAALVVLDPQYRGNLDELKYGNEGARQKGRAKLPQMTATQIKTFVLEAARILRPSGHLFFWVNKHSIGSGQHCQHLEGTGLRTVDIMAWHDGGFGMGYRFRGCTEYLVIAQKEPTRAKGIWQDKGIRDFWVEAIDRNRHPHSKPIQLTERLIRCVSKRGDLVVDPCAGGYITLDACRTTGRTFLGGDLLDVA